MTEKKDHIHSTAFHYLNSINRVIDSFTLSSQVLNENFYLIGFTTWVGECMGWSGGADLQRILYVYT